MAIIRTDKSTGDFFIAHKGYLEDEKLSFKAKGLMSYLFAKPDDWTIYQSQLANTSTDGLDSVRTAMNELLELGYLTKEEQRNDKGQFEGVGYVLSEQPQQSNRVGKSQLGNSRLGKHHTTNNKSTNNKSNNNDNIRALKNAHSNKQLENEFNEWWELYNKKKDKKTAFAKFKTVRKEYDFDTIVNGTKEYLKTISDKQYQKYPKVFLNNESFLNDYTDEYITSNNVSNDNDKLNSDDLDKMLGGH